MIQGLKIKSRSIPSWIKLLAFNRPRKAGPVPRNSCGRRGKGVKFMKLMRVVLAVMTITVIASLSACFPNPGDILGGGGGGAPASVSGKWSIILTSNHGSSNDVDLEANFSQSTSAISASQSVILSSSPCDFGTDFIEGTVSGSRINFTLAFGTGHPT